MAESPKEEIARRLDQYPESALSFFGGGFASVSRLSEAQRRDVLEELIANFKRGTRRVSGAALSPTAHLGAGESERIASVYSLMVGLLSEPEATPEEFVSAAKGNLILPPYEKIALSIATAISARREEINATVALAQLAGEVLPSFVSLDIAIDIRVRVDKGQVKVVVPVAIVHVDTDSGKNELWLQLSRGDLEDVIKKLSHGLEDMKVAEAFSLRGR